MAGKQSQYEKTLQRMAKDYGPILLRALTPEERVRALTPEERVRGLTLEERLLGLDAELQEKIKQLLHNQDGKQH